MRVTTKNRFNLLTGGLALFVMLSVGCGDDAQEPWPTPTPAPTLTDVSPAEGSALGGTQLTLTGTNLATVTTVTVGGAAATSIRIVGETTLTCLTPAGTPGVVDVAVTTGGGTATLASSYTYIPLVTIETVAPATGSSFGGTKLTLTGSGFSSDEAGTNIVVVGGADCSDVNTVDDTQITCTSPSGTAGDVDVVITNDNGSATLADGYDYFSTILLADGGGEPAPAVHNLYAFDARSGRMDLAGPIGFAVTAMDFHPTTGVLYGTTATRTGCCPASGRELITIDPATGAGTLVGPTNDADGVNHLIPGVTFVGDVLYGTDGPGNNLVTIDVTSGLVTVVAGGRPLGPGGAFAADAAGANVYYMTENTSTLWSVDVSTGVFTAGPPLEGSGGSLIVMSGATFHNGWLYAIESSSGIGIRQLVVVNTNEGFFSPVGPVIEGSAINAMASATR